MVAGIKQSYPPRVRIVLISQIPRAVHGLDELLRALGHEPVALLAAQMPFVPARAAEFAELVTGRPPHLDLLVPSSRARMAPLLVSADPDLTICLAFPWKIPADALAVPRHGALNVHPSLLPRHRGPIPVAWTLREGDAELGTTIHYMDAELDTGPILAQATAPLGDGETVDTLIGKMAGLVAELLPRALARVTAGDPGDPQGEDGASYAGHFEEEYLRVDWTRPAREVHNQVLAWRFAAGRGRGPLAELNGETVVVTQTRLDPDEGAVRIECGDGPIWVVATEPV